MARIFSISFRHRGMTHNAMVAVRKTPFFTEYTVNVFDELLSSLLPNNKVVSTSENSFVFTDSTSENDVQLMNDVIRSIAEHVHQMQA